MRFYLLDRLESVIPNESAEAIKCWSLSDEVFNEHFPGFPIVPGVLLIESMAQLMGILIEQSFQETYSHLGKPYPILSIVQKAKFRDIITPGDQCFVRAKLLSLDTMRATGTAEIFVNEKLKAQSELSFTIMNEANLPQNPFLKNREEYHLSLRIKMNKP